MDNLVLTDLEMYMIIVGVAIIAGAIKWMTK